MPLEDTYAVLEYSELLKKVYYTIEAIPYIHNINEIIIVGLSVITGKVIPVVQSSPVITDSHI